MKGYKRYKFALMMLALASLAHAGRAQTTTPPSTNSAISSPSRGTAVINACSAAVDELIASRKLIEALDAENSGLKTSVETERRLNAVLIELNATRKSESDALRNALSAKNEALAAKELVIASQDKLIAELKRKKSSVWRRLGDVLVGAGLGAGVIAILK
ncbi:MAG: hypothetical protein JO053_07060 [Acidobacteria bacterium]|nr:hypothetical protein [Acidobacteriota bacterium]